MTEREYRRLPRDSYSTLKDFLDSRRKYYRKHVQGETIIEEEDETSTTFGSLVDCLLFTPHEFEERFTTVNFTMPTGQMLDFCNALWKRTRLSTTEDGRVTRDFNSIAEDAFNDVAFDVNGNRIAFKQKGMNIQKVLERFAIEGVDYYDHLRSASDKLIVQPQDEQNAENVIRELKSNFATRDIINATTTETIEVLDQLVILWDYLGLPMKSMLDRVIIDHAEKKIYQYDLKTAWNLELWPVLNYLKYRLYLQVACYSAALLSWVQEKGLTDYDIVPMKFIVVDSTAQSNPLVYETDSSHFTDAVRGFKVNGREYVGLRKAVEDLKWHKQMSLWGISKDNFEKRGIVSLNYNQ